MDSTGKVVWRWESDAFGTTLPDEDPDKDGVKTTVNLRFWGYQYADVESGLFYNGHRYYSPLLKIFTQTDRLDLLRQAVNPLYAGYSEPTDLQRALNQPFNYTGNNPMSYVDPLGLSFWSDLFKGGKKPAKCITTLKQALNTYGKQCSKECGEEPKDVAHFIDQYGGGDWDLALFTCACKKAGIKNCEDWVNKCLAPGAF